MKVFTNVGKHSTVSNIIIICQYSHYITECMIFCKYVGNYIFVLAWMKLSSTHCFSFSKFIFLLSIVGQRSLGGALGVKSGWWMHVCSIEGVYGWLCSVSVTSVFCLECYLRRRGKNVACILVPVLHLTVRFCNKHNWHFLTPKMTSSQAK